MVSRYTLDHQHINQSKSLELFFHDLFIKVECNNHHSFNYINLVVPHNTLNTTEYGEILFSEIFTGMVVVAGCILTWKLLLLLLLLGLSLILSLILSLSLSLLQLISSHKEKRSVPEEIEHFALGSRINI